MMTTLNMHPMNMNYTLPNFGMMPYQMQQRPMYPQQIVPNRAINAFAPSLVFDSSYFSQFYYNSGGN